MTSKWHREQVIKSNIKRATHKMTNTRIYKIWQNMLSRCKNKNIPRYKDYGKRGIKVCDRWQKFENFYTDMGECPENLTLDRIDNDKGYFPENCKWSTRAEQVNNARSNIVIEYNNQQLNLSQWARKIGIKYTTLWNRIKKSNWCIEKALTEEIRQWPNT